MEGGIFTAFLAFVLLKNNLVILSQFPFTNNYIVEVNQLVTNSAKWLKFKLQVFPRLVVT